MSERIAAVVYVTKWAGPIWVWKDAKVSVSGYCYHAGYGKGMNYQSVNSMHWTEDRAVAEERWRANRNKDIKAAEKKLNAAAKALRDGPTWEEQ